MLNTTGTTILGDGNGIDLLLSTSASTTAPALSLNNAGIVTVPGGAGTTEDITANGGPAVSVTGTTATLPLGAVSSSSSTTDGIHIDNIGAGTFSTAAAGSSISGAQGTAFSVNKGNGDITYPGTITDGTGATASITNRTGGTVTLSGSITDGTDAGGGITLSGNTAGATVFSHSATTLNTGAGDAVSISMPDTSTATADFTGGGLDIDTTTGKGFSATGVGAAADGKVTVTGSGNTISTGSGTALGFTNVGIGDNDLNFQAISSSGATNGITLTNTSNSGGSLSVNGNSGTCTTPTSCTGGVIKNSTGAGISLSTVPGGVALQNMFIGAVSPTTRTGGDGIAGTTVAGFTLKNSVLASNGDASGERGIDMTNLSGTAALDTDAVSGSFDRNVSLVNDSGSALGMTVTNGSYTTTANGVGIYMTTNTATGPNQTLTITGSTFTNNSGEHVAVTADSNSAATQSVSVSNTNMTSTIPVSGGGITLNPGGHSVQTSTITNNNIQGANVQAITVDGPGSIATPQPSTIRTTITNNTIGTAGTAELGRQLGQRHRHQRERQREGGRARHRQQHPPVRQPGRDRIDRE